MSHGTCGNPACGRRTPDPICWDCTHKLAEHLERIPDLADLLTAAAHVVRNSVGDGTRPHYPPLPFDADIAAFADELHALMVACARDLTETRRIPFMPIGFGAWADFVGPLPRGMRHLPIGYTVSTGDIALWLREHVKALRMCESAGETCIDIARVLQSGVALVTGPAISVYRGPCPTVTGTDHHRQLLRCGNQLYAPRGQDFVICRRCKITHDAAALEQRHVADGSAMLFRFRHLQRVLRELGEPITDRTLSAWIRSGRLKPAGWQRPDGTITTQISRGDAPMYRLADVRKVRAESQAARGSTA